MLDEKISNIVILKDLSLQSLNLYKSKILKIEILETAIHFL